MEGIEANMEEIPMIRSLLSSFLFFSFLFDQHAV